MLLESTKIYFNHLSMNMFQNIDYILDPTDCVVVKRNSV